MAALARRSRLLTGLAAAVAALEGLIVVLAVGLMCTRQEEPEQLGQPLVYAGHYQQQQQQQQQQQTGHNIAGVAYSRQPQKYL